MKVVEGKKFTEGQLRLLEQIKAYSDFFIDKLHQNETVDYSKYFLIFAYNYFSQLDLPSQAEDMLKYVTSDYIAHHFVDDIENAIECRNEFLRLKNRGKDKEAAEQWAEAEFFLVAQGIMPYLNNIAWFQAKHKNAFAEFSADFNSREISFPTEIPKPTIVQ